MKELSLVIATYNRSRQLLDTLTSVTQQECDPSRWECIVVNNNSMDDTIQSTQRFIECNPQYSIHIVTELKQGLSHARNCGINNSEAPIIAIIDDDEVIAPQFITSYIELFTRHPQAAAAGGAIVPRYLTQRPAWMSHYVELPIANPLDLGDTEIVFPRGIIPGGGNMAIRRSAIDKYGAFDPALGRCGEQLLGSEESNLFERLRRAGEQIWWSPTAVMYHLIPAEKLQMGYLRKLWYNIGVSQRRRSKIEDGTKGHRKAVMMELIKWGVTLLLALVKLITLHPQKGLYLIKMRYHITRGLIA